MYNHFYLPMERHVKQKGLTLIEILITILIMGFGLLGVAQMQIVSMKSNYESIQRSEAGFLIEELISRVRTAPSDTDPDIYDSYALTADSSQSLAAKTSGDITSCLAPNNCTVANKVIFDMWEWTQNVLVDSSLFNADSCVTVVNNQLTITIAWDGMGKSKSSKDHDTASECLSDTTKEKIKKALEGDPKYSTVDDHYQYLFKRRQVTSTYTF